MSEQNYIERYWRDATPADAIKEPPMVARFRDSIDCNSAISIWSKPMHLVGWDRTDNMNWCNGQCWWKFCQVYDAPDPGEGWRLIDTKYEQPQEGDEFLLTPRNKWITIAEHPSGGFSGRGFAESYTYRRRIEPPKPEPKYVPFTWEDRDQLRGRWIRWQHENGLTIEACVNHLNEHRNGGLWFKSHDAKWLVENAIFLDTGKPVGKEVAQ